MCVVSLPSQPQPHVILQQMQAVKTVADLEACETALNPSTDGALHPVTAVIDTQNEPPATHPLKPSPFSSHPLV